MLRVQFYSFIFLFVDILFSRDLDLVSYLPSQKMTQNFRHDFPSTRSVQ